MVRKNFKQLILAFAKPLLWNSYRQVYRDIATLLSPCCIPTLTVGEVYACSGSDTEFSEVTVDAGEQNANKNAILLFTFSDAAVEDHTTATVTVTFDANGQWSGGVNTMTYFENGSTGITVSVIIEGSSVLITSASVTAENIQNCD